MIAFINKKLDSDCNFSVFLYFCISVFMYLDWPSTHCSPTTPALPITSSQTKVTDWHTAPSICVTTDKLPGTASVRAQ